MTSMGKEDRQRHTHDNTKEKCPDSFANVQLFEGKGYNAKESIL